MPRLVRPYIPLSIRVVVAERQVAAAYPALLTSNAAAAFGSRHWKQRLDAQLAILAHYLRCQVADLELHHRPALVNRRRKRNGEYDPSANHPDFLIYLRKDDHDVETRIRGLHGQYSDLALARKRKRAAKKRNRGQGRKAFFAKVGKPWGSRKLKTGSRWPAKGSRKIPNRRKP